MSFLDSLTGNVGGQDAARAGAASSGSGAGSAGLGTRPLGGGTHGAPWRLAAASAVASRVRSSVFSASIACTARRHSASTACTRASTSCRALAKAASAASGAVADEEAAPRLTIQVAQGALGYQKKSPIEKKGLITCNQHNDYHRSI